MTATHEASRTLVKSPPELWAELSDPASLARHLGDFGEIRITRLEPETAVAWEGDRASGTVRLEPSGWGTRVVLTAIPLTDEVPAPPSPAPPPPAPPAPVPDPAPPAPAPTPSPPGPAPDPEPPAPLPDPEPLPPAARKPGVLARIRRFLGVRPAPTPVDRPFKAPRTTDTIEAVPGLETTVPPPAPSASVAPPESPADAAPPEAALRTAAEADEPEAILSAALDSLGQAHHRPFSRS